MNSNQKKTQIKTSSHKRRIVVYLPNHSVIDEWNAAAKRNGMTTSRFVQNIMSQYLSEGDVHASQKKMEKKINHLEDTVQHLRLENVSLSKKIEMLNSLADRYEKELRELRDAPFLDNEAFQGVRKYEQRLIDVLRDKRHIREEDIFDVLHVDPHDRKTVKALMTQLENLLQYGVIRLSRGGYRWVD